MNFCSHGNFADSKSQYAPLGNIEPIERSCPGGFYLATTGDHLHGNQYHVVTVGSGSR